MAVLRLNNTAKTQAVSPSASEASPERASSSETVARLQRGILRLALAYHGQNNALDSKLKELGKMLRGGKRDAHLQQLIDDIVDTIVSLDLKHTAESNDEPDTDGSDLLELFLGRVEAPQPEHAQLEALARLIGTKRRDAEVLGQVELAAIAISKRLASEQSDPAAEVGDAREVLVELIERISVPPALASDASSLKHAILAAGDRASLKPCINALADLVARMREELHKELENLKQFLRATAQRLQEFERYISNSRNMHAEASADALQLSDSVSTNITELRSDVTASDDLDSVKKLIENKLDAINEDLDLYVTIQKKRAHEASDTIDKMVHKLQDLESEAEHLREDLEEQHARVLIDPLTGILNRSGYNETATKQFARWKRYGGALSLAVIDLDLFKQINDQYGHAAGDKVLSTVAGKLNEMIRDSDILCRYGGEEFVLLLPETTAGDAVMLLDKLRTEIEHCPFRYKDTPVSVTLSCGIAQFTKSDTLDEVFERADQAMYQAKRNGRNQVYAEPSPAAA